MRIFFTQSLNVLKFQRTTEFLSHCQKKFYIPKKQQTFCECPHMAEFRPWLPVFARLALFKSALTFVLSGLQGKLAAWNLVYNKLQHKGFLLGNNNPFFERELALLVALQEESIWKGGGRIRRPLSSFYFLSTVTVKRTSSLEKPNNHTVEAKFEAKG